MLQSRTSIKKAASSLANAKTKARWIPSHNLSMQAHFKGKTSKLHSTHCWKLGSGTGLPSTHVRKKIHTSHLLKIKNHNTYVSSRFISSTAFSKQNHPSHQKAPLKPNTENTPDINESSGNIGQQIQNALQWRLSDLMGVWGAGLLFFGIIISPYVIKEMKNSSEDYEMDGFSDDDMMALTQQVLESLKESEGLTSNKNEDNESSNVVIDTSSDIISRVLQTDMVQDALIQLSVKIIQSPEVLQAAKILVKNLFQDLVNDPETLVQIVELLNKAILDETVKKAVVELILQLTADEEVNCAVTKMVVALGEEEEVRSKAMTLVMFIHFETHIIDLYFALYHTIR